MADTLNAAGADHGEGAEGAKRSHFMTLPKKRTYDFRIVDWQVFTPEEQERLYMQLLTSERLEVSDTVRKLILAEWPGMSRLFVEHCEAVAAKIDITRRWLGEQ